MITHKKRAAGARHFETGTVNVTKTLNMRTEYGKQPPQELNSHCKIFASAVASIPSEVGRHEHFPSHHLDPSDRVVTLRKINKHFVSY